MLIAQRSKSTRMQSSSADRGEAETQPIKKIKLSQHRTSNMPLIQSRNASTEKQTTYSIPQADNEPKVKFPVPLPKW